MSSCFGSGGGGSVPPCVFVWLGKYWQKTCDTKINNHTFCDNNYSTVVTWQQRLLPIHFFELTQETFIPNTYTNIRQYFNASYHLHHITVKISNRTVSTSHKRMRIRIRTWKNDFCGSKKGKIRTKPGSGNDSFFHIQLDNCIRAVSHTNQLYWKDLSNWQETKPKRAEAGNLFRRQKNRIRTSRNIKKILLTILPLISAPQQGRKPKITLYSNTK